MMGDDMSQKLICIASCAGAFGAKGEMKIKSFTEIPEDLFAYGDLRDADGNVFLTITAHRPVKNAFAVTCEQIQTREQAQALAGTKLYVRRAEMPTPDEDEFYFEDLMGCDVKTVDGRRLGKVLAVYNHGAGDLLEISGGTDKYGKGRGMFFHPFTKVAVPKVDIKNRRVVIKIEDVILAQGDS